MSRFASRLLGVLCVVVSILAFADRATADVRAFSSRGGAQFVSPTDFVGTGHATHLGLYTEAGSVSFSPTSDPAVLQVDGSVVYTAANGDELHAVVTGQLNGLTGVVTATITYVGGTGRFTDASGSSSLAGQLGPNGTISVTVNGTIDY